MSAVISTKLCDLVKSSHAMVCEVESEVESLLLKCSYRLCDQRIPSLYKDIWASYIGEVLQCHCDVHNHHDLLAFWIRQ